MHVVGMAGHVDHGKSALVKALTGTDPDRWEEERLRGMTLDLGFAHLVLEDGTEAGIIDVPGHERFVHNMLAGASGMDVLVLVVAANEGVMPQTREHLGILRYLNVAATIVVASKSDLLSAAELAEAQRDIARELRGTLAEGAPMVAVSSVSGDGLDLLRAEIARALRAVEIRDPRAPAYLPIDRVFTLAGIGTVVTGTLMQGAIALGDTVALEPGGKRARVRSIQVFGAARELAEPGSRVALNLAGIDRHEIARGTVAAGRELVPQTSLAVRFTPVAEALPLLRRRTPVRAHLGSAEILGTLVFDGVPVVAEPCRAELHLRTPAVAFPGVRFVVRRVSPKTLLGGGEVLGVAKQPALEAIDHLEGAALAALRLHGLEAVETHAVAAITNVREEVAQRALDALVERQEAMRVARPAAYVDGSAAYALLTHAVAHLEDAQHAEPWAMGVTSIALGRALDVAEALLVRILAAFVEDGRIAHRAGYYSTLDHQPQLSPDQHRLFDGIVPIDPARPLLPVPYDAVLTALRASRVAGAAKAFDTMVARGALVRIEGELYRGAQIADIHARVEAYLLARTEMTAAEFRDLIGTSRKYAVPLLEWLDARAITIRSGDRRMLRKKAP
jgi:selenocysteine-specific elongation factor